MKQCFYIFSPLKGGSCERKLFVCLFVAGKKISKSAFRQKAFLRVFGHGEHESEKDSVRLGEDGTGGGGGEVTTHPGSKRHRNRFSSEVVF